MVKIDVEGYEEEVLQGMTNILSSKPKIFMELHNFKFEDKLSYVTNILKIIPHLHEYKMCYQLANGGDIIYKDRFDETLLKELSDVSNPHLYFYN